jgi:hypothetical protein
MVELTSTLPANLDRIKEWIAVDPWHKDDPTFLAEGLLTGQGLLSFCVADSEGPLCFVRLDAEGDMVRFATQFGPEAEVSKRRLITGLLSTGIPALIAFAKDKGYKGLVFETTNESLINFMDKQGFKTAGNNDYALVFKENINV